MFSYKSTWKCRKRTSNLVSSFQNCNKAYLLLSVSSRYGSRTQKSSTIGSKFPSTRLFGVWSNLGQGTLTHFFIDALDDSTWLRGLWPTRSCEKVTGILLQEAVLLWVSPLWDCRHVCVRLIALEKLAKCQTLCKY